MLARLARYEPGRCEVDCPDVIVAAGLVVRERHDSDAL
jgi:hypothetical protein